MFKPVMADRIVDEHGNKIGLYRCDLDGALVLNKPEHLQNHPGHKVKSPVVLNWFEQMGIKFGWIK